MRFKLGLAGLLLVLAISCGKIIPPKEEAIRYAADAYEGCASAKATLIHHHDKTATYRVRCAKEFYLITCWHLGRDNTLCDNPVYRCRTLGREPLTQEATK